VSFQQHFLILLDRFLKYYSRVKKTASIIIGMVDSPNHLVQIEILSTFIYISDVIKLNWK